MATEPQHISPRVNSALFPKYQNKVVRLTCKVLAVHGDRATVLASDGGELHVQMSTDHNISEETPYVELIGTVLDSTTLKVLTCLNMKELDMTVVDQAINLMHDPRYAGRFWGPS